MLHNAVRQLAPRNNDHMWLFRVSCVGGNVPGMKKDVVYRLGCGLGRVLQSSCLSTEC